MIGRQPTEAVRVRRVAEIFAASFALRRAKDEAFDELLSDMPSTTLGDYVKDLKARWKGLVRPNQPDEAREILLDLVDQNIDALEAILERFDEQTLEEKARGSYNRVSHDSSREAESMRRNWVRFKNGLARGSVALTRCRKDRIEREGRSTEEAVDKTEGGGRRAEERRILARGERPWYEDVNASDALACQGFVPERCLDTLVDGLEEEALRAEDGGRRTEEMDIADGESVVVASEPAGGEAFATNDDGSEGENVTNEPKLDEGAHESQHEPRVEVAANSEVDSGLDNELKTNPNPAFDRKEDQVSNPKSERSESQDSSHCVERIASWPTTAPSPVAERTPPPPAAAPPLKVERTPRQPKAAPPLREGRKAKRKAMAQRELDRRIRAQIDGSGSERDGFKLIEELRAAAMEEFRWLQPSIPRAP
jgi:hypothetical protein